MSQVWSELDERVKRSHQRAYELLGNDLLTVFSYVEPCLQNRKCFGHQIYQLFLQVSTEFEAVCKLACTRLEPSIKPPSDKAGWKFDFYEKLQDFSGDWERNGFPNPIGRLSDYRFTIYSCENEISPLSSFDTPFKIAGQKSTRKPKWYSDYNDVKHSREKEFKKANLSNLIYAFCSLVAVLDWQGIRVNRWIPEVSDNEFVVGEKFGFFTVGADLGRSSRVYF